MTPSTVNHRRAPMLRVKVKSLGAEIRMIRDEERRMKRAGRRCQAKGERSGTAATLHQERWLLRDALTFEDAQEVLAKTRAARDAFPVDPVTNYYDVAVFQSLRAHQGSLSVDARIAHLAACALRGTPYARCETANARDLPSFARVIETALRFGGEVEVLAAWLDAAREFVGETRGVVDENVLLNVLFQDAMRRLRPAAEPTARVLVAAR